MSSVHERRTKLVLEKYLMPEIAYVLYERVPLGGVETMTETCFTLASASGPRRRIVLKETDVSARATCAVLPDCLSTRRPSERIVVLTCGRATGAGIDRRSQAPGEG
jgi:hypothetical protein